MSDPRREKLLPTPPWLLTSLNALGGITKSFLAESGGDPVPEALATVIRYLSFALSAIEANRVPVPDVSFVTEGDPEVSLVFTKRGRCLKVTCCEPHVFTYQQTLQPGQDGVETEVNYEGEIRHDAIDVFRGMVDWVLNGGPVEDR